jgi:hypothetical protein
VEHEIEEEKWRRRLTACGQRSSDEVVERRREQECGCARGDRRKEKFTGRVPKLKRGVQAGGKQLLVVDGMRGGSGGQRRDAFARGGASGVD